MTGAADSDGSDGSDPRLRAHGRVDDGLIAVAPDHRITELDASAERLLGVDADAVRGTELSEAVPALADGTFESHCLTAVERDETVEFERAAVVGDGRLRFRIYPGDDGLTVRIEPLPAGPDTNSTDEQPIVASLTDPAVTVDSEGTIQRANSAVEPLFGYEPAELVGEPLTTLLPDHLTDRHVAAFQRYLETGDRRLDWRDIEFPARREDGEERAVSISLTEHGSGDDRRITGVFRDISERKQREEALQRAYETFSDPDLDFDEQVQRLLELGTAVLDMEFGTLSQVRNNEYRFDRIVAPEGAGLRPGDTIPLEATNCEYVVSNRETLALAEVDHEAPETAEAVEGVDLRVSAYLGVPVIVDNDAVGTFCFYDREPRAEAFSEWEVTFIEHLSQWVAQSLEQQRYVEQLHALNEVNGVVHEVADTIIEESTREEIEQRVCESLAATDSYLFAWIGQPNPGSQQVEMRAEAGVDGYLDDVTISVDEDTDEGRGPTGRALQTGEVQTLQRVNTAPEYEPWHDIPKKYGFRSSAAIPISHEGTNYGVLNLYTERPNAFEGQEREMVALLGKMVGHAIAATERKQALLSDSMVELSLRTSDVLPSLGISEPPSAPVTLEAAVPRSEGEYVLFGDAAIEDREFVEELAEKHPHWSELVNIEEADGRLRFEVVLSEPPLLEALSAAGGQLGKAVLEGADMRMEIHLPPRARVRNALDGVREAYPSTSLVSKQEISAQRPSDGHGMHVQLAELTERQRESLRTAYHAGYFEWPRESSGEEVAELLGIAAPTFSQHLRGAERTVFGALFDEESL